MRRLVILDFDGTMTDAEAEGQPFWRGYLEDLSSLTGREHAEIDKLAEKFEAEVLAAPQAYGWLWKGRIVCPATVDPYQRMMPVAAKIFDACGVFKEPKERERLQELLFKYNYKKTARVFRPYAAQSLEALGIFDTYVVTNAHVEPVRAKIADLDGRHRRGSFSWLAERVIGRASKHVVEDRELDLPAELTLPGLDRPVLVRRPHYRALLERLRADAPWDQVTVIGDIFELDLALPLVLGAHVVLVTNSYTPPWEKSFVAGHPRGHVIDDLREIEAIVAR